MKRILMLIMVGFLLSTISVAQGQKTTQQAMRLKLDYARGVLEGLTTAKYDLVVTNAMQLRDLSVTNAFLLTGNPEYLRRSTNFFVSIDRLVQAAKDENLDRAAAAYGEVTRNCIECHKTFRREQFVESQRKNLLKQR